MRRSSVRPAARRLLWLVPVLAMLAALAPVRHPVPAHADAVTFTREGDRLRLANAAITVLYNLRSGLMDVEWGALAAVRSGYASVTLLTAGDPQRLHSFDAATRSFDQERVSDALGGGIRLTVRGESPATGFSLTQYLTVYDNLPFVLLRVEAGRATGNSAPMRTREIEVLAAGGVTDPPGRVTIGTPRDPRLYRAPFDNDGDFEVPRAAEQHGTISYWLTALFDAAGSGSLVAGATESRVWKSAAWYDGPTASLSLFSGAPSPADTEEPPARAGDRIASAEFLVGGYADYRDGLADLMRVVALREPPLREPPLPPPLGWNPWYQYAYGATEETVRDIANALVGEWASLGYRYVNLDAGWNVKDGDWRPNPERFPSGMSALTTYIHERGLLAGSYLIPFAVNGDLLDTVAPGANVTFRELAVKDAAGAPLHADILTPEYVLDGSHPGTLAYLRTVAAGIAADGFDFVKLDFLQIGTQEGRRYDPTVTAMQAFHLGMEAVRDGLNSAGRPVYVSAAISPLYVQPYAHARRVGTDVNFGQQREAQNIALSWFTELLYARNDPDNVVVRPDWYPEYSDAMARVHATMAALGGSLFILGDDPRSLSPERAALLKRRDVLALALDRVSARPVDVRETPAAVWVAKLKDGAVAVGAFNWGNLPVRRAITFAALGLDATRPHRVVDLWSGATVESTGVHYADLPPRSAALLRIEP